MHPEYIPIKPVTINDTEIITTESYKYLGKILSTELNPDEQWSQLSKKINSNIFLIKTMKNLGFKNNILITIVKSLILSHIISNSTILCAASSSAKNEMENIMNRIIKILNISQESRKLHNLTTIQELIDTNCIKILTKILENPEHPLTKSITKPQESRHSFKFNIEKSRTTKYEKSFLHQYLTKIESSNRTQTQLSSNQF